MRLIKYFSLIPVILILLVSCSCLKGVSDLKIEISPSDKSLVDLASKIYDETQLWELARFKGPMKEKIQNTLLNA